MKTLSANVAVVIPNHREELDDLEKISLAQCRKVLGRYPIVFVAPEGINFSYVAPGEPVVRFPKEYFQSLRGYNILSVSPLFYEPFMNFDYILIYQLDAFVFYDALEEFCQLGWDYIGAPWPYHAWQGSRKPRTPRVGNGGFCLRKVKACHELLKRASAFPNWAKLIENGMEDSVFALCGMYDEKNFKVAPVEVAKLFSMEWYPARHVKKLGNELPFGCHGWTKFSADFYVELFAQLGYDLRPLRDQMKSEDYQEKTELSLINLAMRRLSCRVERGQSFLQYLPAKNFSSVRVIRSVEAMKILASLLTEENSLADKIFIYDEKNFRDLIRDVTREDLPHLVIVSDYDKSLIAAIERKGLTYGEHVISFQREYIKFQEKIFHNLGRSVQNGN